MNKMARILTRGLALLTVCTALSAPLLAQDTPPPPPPEAQQGPPPGGPGGRMNPERRLQMMKEQLGLSDEQTAKVKAILDETRGKMEGVRADSSLSQDDARAKMMAINQEQNGKIRAVLTADQQTKFDEMQKRMRGPRGGPGGPPPGGAGGSPQL